MYQGQCVQIDRSDRVGDPVPSSLEGKYALSFIILKVAPKKYLEQSFRRGMIIFAYHYIHITQNAYW